MKNLDEKNDNTLNNKKVSEKIQIKLLSGLILSNLTLIVMVAISFFKDIEILSAKIMFLSMIIGILFTSLVINRKEKKNKIFLYNTIALIFFLITFISNFILLLK